MNIWVEAAPPWYLLSWSLIPLYNGVFLRPGTTYKNLCGFLENSWTSRSAEGYCRPDVCDFSDHTHELSSTQVIDFDDGSGSVLRIQPLRTHRDEAIYECTATNSVGEINTSAKLTVLEGKRWLRRLMAEDALEVWLEVCDCCCLQVLYPHSASIGSGYSQMIRIQMTFSDAVPALIVVTFLMLCVLAQLKKFCRSFSPSVSLWTTFHLVWCLCRLLWPVGEVLSHVPFCFLPITWSEVQIPDHH